MAECKPIDKLESLLTTPEQKEAFYLMKQVEQQCKQTATVSDKGTKEEQDPMVATAE